MVSHSGLITVMTRAARKAAPRLRRDFGEVEQLQVSRKGPADFVSMADERAEQTLVEELRHARPDWGLLLEEGGEIEGNPAKPRWIVDPIDGTSNFIHGIPHFAISIAVQEARPGGNGWGEISHGLVYHPLTDESFWAEKGRGAWLQDRRLRVSSRREMADALIATGIPYKGHGDHDRFRRIFDAVAPEVAGIRRFGSAALDLAWVAAGRYDGFWEEDLQFWDIAAGLLLVREAGGFVTDFRGSDVGHSQGPDARRQRPDPFAAAQADRRRAARLIFAAGAALALALAASCTTTGEPPTMSSGEVRRSIAAALEAQDRSGVTLGMRRLAEMGASLSAETQARLAPLVDPALLPRIRRRNGRPSGPSPAISATMRASMSTANPLPMCRPRTG